MFSTAIYKFNKKFGGEIIPFSSDNCTDNENVVEEDTDIEADR
jgi:hypothetical protein